jgi:hypothetical protein
MAALENPDFELVATILTVNPVAHDGQLPGVE